MKKLFKSSTNKVFDGVCGGIGEYFNIDPVIIRILWMLLVIFGGTGFIAYIIAMFIIPREEEMDEAAKKAKTEEPLAESHSGRLFSTRFWGILLITIGGLMLLRYIDPIWSVFSVMGRFMVSIIWPIGLIILGIYLMVNRRREGESFTGWFKPETKLHRSRADRRIAGVCGGVGESMGIDGNIIRILWVMATLTSIGFGLLVYIIMAIFVPEEP